MKERSFLLIEASNDVGTSRVMMHSAARSPLDIGQRLDITLGKGEQLRSLAQLLYPENQDQQTDALKRLSGTKIILVMFLGESAVDKLVKLVEEFRKDFGASSVHCPATAREAEVWYDLFFGQTAA